MGPPNSHRVPRARHYLGNLQEVKFVSNTGLSPSMAGLSRPLLLRNPFLTSLDPCRDPRRFPRPRIHNICRLSHVHGLGFSLFARRYSGNRGFFLLLKVLRCFSSHGYSPQPIDSAVDTGTLLPVGFPIRKSPDHSLVSGYPKLFAATPRPS